MHINFYSVVKSLYFYVAKQEYSFDSNAGDDAGRKWNNNINPKLI